MSDFKVKTWKKGEPIDLRHLGPMLNQIMPVELHVVDWHVKADGTTDGTPSHCLVLKYGSGFYTTAQISDNMLRSALAEAEKMRGTQS